MGFLFAFHSNYDSLLYRFRDKARYWSKIAIFFILPLRSTFLSIYCHTVWYGKTRTVCLLEGKKKFEDWFSRFDRIPAFDRRIDRRADRQTDILQRHSLYQARSQEFQRGSPSFIQAPGESTQPRLPQPTIPPNSSGGSS